MFADIFNLVKEGLPETNDVAMQYRGDIVGYATHRLGIHLTPDMKAFLLSVQNNTITVVQSGTSLGKTFSEAVLALYFHECYPDSQVYLTAPPPVGNLQHQLWAEILNMITRANLKISSGNLLIKGLHSKHFIRGLSIPLTGTREDKVAKFSGKHAPVLVWGVDEGDAVPDEVYEGIDGCMSGGEIVRLFISFNPKKRSGRVYDLITNGRANVVKMSAFTHPNVVTGYNGIPGAITREYVVRKTHEWCEYIPEFVPVGEDLPSGIFQLPSFLDNAKCVGESGEMLPPLMPGYYRVVDGQYSYKIIGEYPSDGSNQLIPQQYVDEAISRWISRFGNTQDFDHLEMQHIGGVAGLDVADEGADTSCLVRRYGVIFPKPIVYHAENAGEAGQRAVMDCISNNISALNVDGIGVGASAVFAARNRVRELNHRQLTIRSIAVSESPKVNSIHGKFAKYRDQLYWNLRTTFVHKNPLMYPDPELIKQLGIVTYEEDANGRIKVLSKASMKAKLGGRSPDELEAIMLTEARNQVDIVRI
jgi:hypothetical protein